MLIFKKKLLDVLKPIKLAVEALCRTNINLLTADVLVQTLCQQLLSIRTSLGKTMFESIKTRIEEKRDSNLYTLISFFKNLDIFNDDNDFENLFSNASKDSVFSYAEQLYDRLFCGETELNEFETSDESDIELEITFEEKLNAAIKNTNEKTKSISNSQTSSIKKDLTFFEGSGQKTENIQKLFDALLTIRPTSVESERVLSLTGLLVTKIRNRLSDETINALTVLKTYFKNQKE